MNATQSKNGWNGSWRTWLLGVLATLAVTLIMNGIVFQRDTRESLATHANQINALQSRDENIIKFLTQRVDGLERRLEQLEKK